MSTDGSAPAAEQEGPTLFTRGRLSRGRGLRKTTGCLVCRRRRVKCDEGKPECGGCRRTNNTCVYSPQKNPASRRATISRESDDKPALITSSASSSTQEQTFENEQQPEPAETPTDPQLETMLHEEAVPPGSIMDHSPPAALENPPTVPSISDLGAPPAQSPAHASPTDRFMSTLPSMLPPPQVAVSSTSSGHQHVETATAKWVGLLFQDAVVQNQDLWNMNFEEDGFDIFGNSVTQTPLASPPQLDFSHQVLPTEGRTPSSNPSLSERIAILNPDQVVEKKEWQSVPPISITPAEHIAFQRFIRHISEWLDLFDPAKSFETHVPRLAVHNVGLMNAILALSTRYATMSSGDESTYQVTPHDALQYYYKTLHYIREAMQYDTYKVSLELVATSLIISTFEMLDGTSRDWERHLHGVFWIQRSQVIHGDSKGLRQAVWWAWLCQDVFAAYMDKRTPFTFWRPLRNLSSLDPYELAARSVYFFAQVVGYSSFEEIEAGKSDPVARMSKESLLRENLKEWYSYLTIEFQPLPLPQTERRVFAPIWIHPPNFAVAMQLYHASNILLYLHSPATGNYSEYARARKSLKDSIAAICGIAMTLDDYASTAICSQCLFIAGLPMEDPEQRCVVLELLDNCRRRAGWPIRSLHIKLMESWKSMD